MTSLTEYAAAHTFGTPTRPAHLSTATWTEIADGYRAGVSLAVIAAWVAETTGLELTKKQLSNAIKYREIRRG
jgi:hypothetical protein